MANDGLPSPSTTAQQVEAAMGRARHLHVGLRTAHCSSCGASIERIEEPSTARWFDRCLDFVTWHQHRPSSP